MPELYPQRRPASSAPSQALNISGADSASPSPLSSTQSSMLQFGGVGASVASLPRVEIGCWDFMLPPLFVSAHRTETGGSLLLAQHSFTVRLTRILFHEHIPFPTCEPLCTTRGPTPAQSSHQQHYHRSQLSALRYCHGCHQQHTVSQ